MPLVSPPSNHSTVMLRADKLTPVTRAEWMRPLLRWMSTWMAREGRRRGDVEARRGEVVISHLHPYGDAS